MGLYHPHEELHHIKKENIGLIEVMGLAILPGRLKKENSELKKRLNEKFSIKGMIGKGSRSKEVVDSMKKNGVTYFAAVGGAAALIAKSVKKYEVLAYPELGPEALARLTVEDFPAIVVIDCEGNNLYDVNQKKYRTLKGY